MRSLALFVLMLLATPAVRADPVTLFEGGLQLELPVVFRAWEEAAIDELFKESRSRPSALYGTPDGETRVSVTYTDSPLRQEELEETRGVLKSKIESGAKVAWLRDEMVTVLGSSWFRLDYDLVDGAKREIIMGTVLRDRLLFVIVATPIEDWELMGPELDALLGSLRVNQDGVTDPESGLRS